MLAEHEAVRESLYLKIGEILVKAGKISIEQLDTALDKQRLVNKKLGEVLIMMSLITPDELQLYLLNQKSIEKIDLKNFAVDTGLILQIGKEFCLDQKIVPIEIQEIAGGHVLRFAFYSVNDLPNLKKSGELQKFKLIPYLAQKEEIENLLKNLENTEKDVQIYTSLESTKTSQRLEFPGQVRPCRRKVSDVFFEFKAGQLKIFFRNGEIAFPRRISPREPEGIFCQNQGDLRVQA